jgi:Mn2+/Fe2+ NRAMP family transporter
MNKKPTRADAPKQTSKTKGELIVLVVLAVFVVVAIAAMVAIDHYGTQRMGDPARIRDAADR